MKELKRRTGLLDLAFLAFAAFFLEPVLLFVEALAYNNADLYAVGLGANLLHWVLISVLWGLAGWGLFAFARKYRGFDLTRFTGRPSKRAWRVTGLLLLVMILLSAALHGFQFRPLAEMALLVHRFGYGGLPAFLFQYLYYLLEAMLLALAIAFAQQAGEQRFPGKRLPWGGLFLAFTWGLAHFALQGAVTGICMMASAMAYGCAYLLMKKNMSYAYLVIFCMLAL